MSEHVCGSTATSSGEPCQTAVSEPGETCWREGHVPDSLFGHIQHPKKRAFVAALARTGNVTRACEAADIDQSTPYTPQWQDDGELQEAWDEALGVAADVLEAEAVRRAVEGVRKPYVHGGEVARDEHGDPIYLQEYSDSLLIFLLKGVKPEKFAQRQELKHSGRIEGGDVHVYLPSNDRDELPEAVRERMSANGAGPE